MSANTSPDNIVYPVGTDPITNLNTVMGTMATSMQNALNTHPYRVADHAALAALSGMTSGALASVTEGGAIFRYNGSTWVQRTEALFGSAAARDTAYAKASGAYRVQGAEVYRSDVGWREEWQTTVTATVAHWAPVSGARPSGSIIRNTNIDSWTSTTDKAVPFEAATFTRGMTWTVGQPTRLYSTIRGRYLLQAFVAFGTAGNGTAYFRINGTTNRPSLTQPNASGAATLGLTDVVTLNAGDYIEVMTQSSGVFTLFGGGTQLNADYLNVR